MKCSHVTGLALAALFLAACGANAKYPSASERAAEQAEKDKREAQEEAREAREEAMKERHEAQEAAREEREAERDAQLASQREAVARAQAAREAREAWAAAPRAGAAEAQGDGAARVGVKAVVLFAPGKTELSTEAKAKLDEVALALRARGPARRVIIDGYADDTGPEATNAQLSERRAQEVASYLESQGVARERVVTKGFGSRHQTDDSDRGRALDRRVEVVVQPADHPTDR